MRIELDQLIARGRNITPPMEIALTDGVCTMTEIRRLLPGRRLAGRGAHRGGEVFVKLFFGKGARRACNREKRGAAILRQSGVRTPKLLLETTTEAPGGYALLFEYLDSARPIGSGVSPRNRPAQESGDAKSDFSLHPKADIAESALLAVAALARLHESGAKHRDANLNNFLVGDEHLYLVDGAAIHRKGSALGETASLKALAAFLAEYPPARDDLVPALLARYASERGGCWAQNHATPNRASKPPRSVVDTKTPPGSREQVADETHRRSNAGGASPGATSDHRNERLRLYLGAARRRRVRRYLAKTERNCTEFHCERGWHKAFFAKRVNLNAALAEFAQNPQAGLSNAEIIKNGRSATVYRLQLGSDTLVVKRYNLKSTWHRIRRWFKHRARIAWRNGHRLAFLGIPTAEPIALIERRWGPLRAESWLVMPDCGSLDIQTEVAARGWNNSLLTGVVRLFRDMETAGLWHGDTKASNFLIHNGEVRLIDYDGVREYPGATRDIARFLENFAGQARACVTEKFRSEGLIV